MSFQTNFPAPGTQPDLVFYYNRNTYKQNSNNLGTSKNFTPFVPPENTYSTNNWFITEKEGQDPVTQNIGEILQMNTYGDTVYNFNWVVTFNNLTSTNGVNDYVSSSILFQNVIGDDSLEGSFEDGAQLLFRITGGTGNFMYSNGWLVAKVDPNGLGGRNWFVYFFKNSIPFPAPGTAPDLTFYYNSAVFDDHPDKYLGKGPEDNQPVQNDFLNTNWPIVLNPGDNPETQSIGYVLQMNTTGDELRNNNWLIRFKPEAGNGSISFTNVIQGDSEQGFAAGRTLIFTINGGTGNYTFAQGWVVVSIDENRGRNWFVYFFKESIPFPVPGTPPDLIFYYDKSTAFFNDTNPAKIIGSSELFPPVVNPVNTYGTNNWLITLLPGQDPATQSIGNVLQMNTDGDEVYNGAWLVRFNKNAGGGSIRFTNVLLENSDEGFAPGRTLVWRIEGGSGNYIFAQGYVVCKVDETNVGTGRNFYVYFFK
jgi:hypothetical protein